VSARQLISYSWIVLAIVWVITGVLAKPATRRQSPGSRLAQLGGTVLGFVLIFNSSLPLGPLDERLYSPSVRIAYLGAAMTVLGVAFAIWARFYLGSNWSGGVTVKQDHALIRSGPYALVRHPIYTGILFAALGSAITYARSRGFLGVLVLLITVRIKLRLEEQFMQQQFGAQYTTYKHEVKALVPFIW
jgi:protein-S-isoprenylcysteine O-methyltransferase Ste14